MSNLSHRIKEIVTQARGNRSQAERLIKETIARDPQFLRQLVDPFLPGIIAHALSREIAPASMPSRELPQGGLDALMRGLQDKAYAPSVVAKAPGQGHADTIRALAEAQRQRRDGK